MEDGAVGRMERDFGAFETKPAESKQADRFHIHKCAGLGRCRLEKDFPERLEPVAKAQRP